MDDLELAWLILDLHPLRRMMDEPINQIRGLIDQHCVGRRSETQVPGLTLLKTLSPNSAVNTMYRPTLCVVAQGRKQVVLGDQVITYDASQYLIVTVDLPVTGCIVEATPDCPYLGLMLDLDPVRIADLLIELGSDGLPSCKPAGMAVSALGGDLLDPLTRLLRLLGNPTEAAVLAPLIKREIYFRLLRGEQGSLLRQVGTVGSYLSQIGHAVDWIRLHHAEPVSVAFLAARAGMSVTSFHRHFKAITRLSPLQYRAQIRLQEARRLMLAEGRDVGAIGFDVGYDSPSQFSREYRKMFGLTPAVDAARLRRRASA